MNKSNVIVNVPMDEYLELLEAKKTVDKLKNYVDSAEEIVKASDKTPEFKEGDRVKIIGATWNCLQGHVGEFGVIYEKADADGDYGVVDISKNEYKGYYPPSSLELIEN